MLENLLQYQAAGLEGYPLRIERGQSGGDQICIDGNRAIGLLGRNSSAKVVFPSPLGPAIMIILFSD
jgi:hypothetical protein